MSGAAAGDSGSGRPNDATPSPPTAAAAFTPASLPRRLAALSYEALLLGALVLILMFLFTLPLTPPGDSAVRPVVQVPPLAIRLMFFLALFAAGAVHCVWFWSGGRRSLPMKTWHMALVRADGAVVEFRMAAIRYLATWIGPALTLAGYLALRPLGQARWALALLAINYAWALVDRDRCFLHDRIAGTRLVRDAPLPAR